MVLGDVLGDVAAEVLGVVAAVVGGAVGGAGLRRASVGGAVGVGSAAGGLPRFVPLTSVEPFVRSTRLRSPGTACASTSQSASRGSNTRSTEQVAALGREVDAVAGPHPEVLAAHRVGERRGVRAVLAREQLVRIDVRRLGVLGDDGPRGPRSPAGRRRPSCRPPSGAS